MAATALDCIQEDNIMQLLSLCNNLKKEKKEEEVLEQRDMYGNTALLKACYLGKLECCRILLNYGANIRAINYLGQNALTLASYCGDLNVIHHLLNIRTYMDFNESSIVPAVCVAALCGHEHLLSFYESLDENYQEGLLHTAHEKYKSET